MRVELTVNGERRAADVEPRTLLADFLRDVGLTGTHLGCEHGVCGACTVLLDGEPVRSCLLLAVQANGSTVTTVEGLAQGDRLSTLQQAFWEARGLQCGFCTPGFLISLQALLDEKPDATREEITETMSGHVCRCTGYHSILAAAELARDRLKERR